MKGIMVIGVIVLIVIPAALAWVAGNFQTGVGRPTLEFLLGTWPAQQYDKELISAFQSNSGWLYFGVVLRSYTLFAIPAILGIVIAWLIKGLERRMGGMLVREYLAYRDQFIRTEIYASFCDSMEKAGIKNEEFHARLKDTFKQADMTWRTSESQTYAATLDKLSL